MVEDHRAAVWASRIVGLGMAARLFAGFAWLGFFLNLIVSPWDRAYAAGSLTLGVVGGLIGYLMAPAIGSAKGPLGRAVKREIRRVHR